VISRRLCHHDGERLGHASHVTRHELFDFHLMVGLMQPRSTRRTAAARVACSYTLGSLGIKCNTYSGEVRKLQCRYAGGLVLYCSILINSSVPSLALWTWTKSVACPLSPARFGRFRRVLSLRTVLPGGPCTILGRWTKSKIRPLCPLSPPPDELIKMLQYWIYLYILVVYLWPCASCLPLLSRRHLIPASIDPSFRARISRGRLSLSVSKLHLP